MTFMFKNDSKQNRLANGHHGLSMIVNWLTCIIFTIYLPSLISGNNSKPFYTKSDLVIDSFVIKTNTIIRTSDSLNAGAKYLSETEMSSSQQCLLWCWDNRNCTLAVYEEKSQGSCYLFDCGPPDQMKCKFTGHDHYTSSLIKFNRYSVDGNTIDQRNQAKHESDLVNLRSTSTSTTSAKPIPISNNNSNGVYVTSTTSGSLILPPSSGLSPYTSTSASINACKRHQFQCRNSSDCIAIYNVCDGIVQCSDGSDEAVDLHCPSESVYTSIESQVAIPPPNGGSNHQRSASPPIAASPSSSSSSSSTSVSSSVPSSTINFSNSPNKNEMKENEVTNGIKNHPFDSKKPIDATDFNYPKSPDFVNDLKENGRLPMNSHKFNDFNPGRDKFEAKSYYPNYGGQYYQPPPPPPPPPSSLSAPGAHGDFYNGPRPRGFPDSDYPNNFPRDVNYWQPETGLVGPNSNMRSNNLDHSLINSIYHQYRSPNEIGPMSVNGNDGIASHPQTSPLIRSVPWSKNSYIDSYPHKPSETPNNQNNQVTGMELAENQGSVSGGANNDGNNNSNRQNVMARTAQEYSPPVRKAKNSQSFADDLKEHANKIETGTRTVAPTTTVQPIVSPTPTLQVAPNKAVAHLNSDKMTNDWEMPIAVTHLSSSQSGRDTNSAVIALVLGVGISAMLIALVGCRMKFIKRRIARRGRNLAHDADYLVNGMYL